MADETGVTTWTATRLQMIEALHRLPALVAAVPGPQRRRPSLRRTPPAAPQRAVLPLPVPEMADAILARLPEAERAPGIAENPAVVEIIGRMDAEIAGLREKLELRDALIPVLTGRARRAEEQVAAVRVALERLAAAGVMATTARRKLAGAVLSLLDAAAAGEAVAADEPA